MKYRNIIEVEAWRLSAKSRQSIKDELDVDAWFYESNGNAELYVTHGAFPYMGNVATDGDWIIRHPTGGLSIMSHDKFIDTYEPSLPSEPSPSIPLQWIKDKIAVEAEKWDKSLHTVMYHKERLDAYELVLREWEDEE